MSDANSGGGEDGIVRQSEALSAAGSSSAENGKERSGDTNSSAAPPLVRVGDPGKESEAANLAALREKVMAAGGWASATDQRKKSAKRRRITDLHLSPAIGVAVPEARVYNHLLSLESRVDAADAQRRAALRDVASQPIREVRTVRFTVFNTVRNQRDQPLVDDAGPSWTLRVQGRVLNAEESDRRNKSREAGFLGIFRTIAVEFPDGEYETVEVQMRSRDGSEKSGFELTRPGSANVQVNIVFTLDRTPDTLKLNAKLADLLQLPSGTRSEILTAMWLYVKVNKLQDPEDRTTVNCDKRMAEVFGCNRVPMRDLADLIEGHLQPLPPLLIPYTVRMSTDTSSLHEVYEMRVEIETPKPSELPTDVPHPYAFEEHPNAARDMQILDDEISILVDRIRHHDRRREFLERFAEDPVPGLNDLLRAHARAIEDAGAEEVISDREREAVRKSEFYMGPWVYEAVQEYIEETRKM